MALFGKKKDSATPANAVRGTALIVESNRDSPTGAQSERSWIEIGWEATAGVKYQFLLEVRPPNGEPYRVTINDRVTSGTEGAGIMGPGTKIPAGIELPVWIGQGGPDDVKLDWSGYRANPEAKAAAADASQAEYDRNYAENFLPKQSLKMQEQLKSSALMSMNLYAPMVKTGQVDRATFEEEAQQSLRRGLVTAEQYAAAVGVIEG
jgi:hypothetical protein